MLHDVAGDVAAAGTALAGLILVYLGAVGVRYESLNARLKAEKRANLRAHAWLAFIGIVSALVAVFLALIAKSNESDSLTTWAAVALIVALGIAVTAAFWTLNSIK